MKPQIFIAMHYMEIGGAETALIGLLHALNPELVDVDLFIYSHQGEMMRFIPEWVNLLPENPAYSALEKHISKILLSRQWKIALARLGSKLISFITKNNKSIGEQVSLCTDKYLPLMSSDKKYDLAISFLTPHLYLLKKVNAKQKMAWIHTDYTAIACNEKLELPIWEKYDYVTSISSDITKTFLTVFPSLKSKIVEIENIIPASFVRQRADEYDASHELEGK